VADPETKVTRLSNGLTVASQDNKDLSTCTVSVVCVPLLYSINHICCDRLDYGLTVEAGLKHVKLME